MSCAYRLNGLRVDSDFDLPALPAWGGGAATDIAVRRGPVPPRLDSPDCGAPLFQTRGPDVYLLLLPGSGRFLVRDGREIPSSLKPAPTKASSALS